MIRLFSIELPEDRIAGMMSACMNILRLASVTAVLAASGALAQDLPDQMPGLPDARTTTPITFRHHASQATIEGVVARNEFACYTFVARKGQRLDTSLDDKPLENIFLQAYEPGYRVERLEPTVVYGPVGQSLPGLGDGSDQKEVHTRLPKSGQYIICLMTGMGGAGRYRMTISIK